MKTMSILFDTFARFVERRAMVWQTAGRRAKGSSAAPVAVTASVPT